MVIKICLQWLLVCVCESQNQGQGLYIKHIYTFHWLHIFSHGGVTDE